MSPSPSAPARTEHLTVREVLTSLRFDAATVAAAEETAVRLSRPATLAEVREVHAHARGDADLAAVTSGWGKVRPEPASIIGWLATGTWHSFESACPPAAGAPKALVTIEPSETLPPVAGDGDWRICTACLEFLLEMDDASTQLAQYAIVVPLLRAAAEVDAGRVVVGDVDRDAASIAAAVLAAWSHCQWAAGYFDISHDRPLERITARATTAAARLLTGPVRERLVAAFTTTGSELPGEARSAVDDCWSRDTLVPGAAEAGMSLLRAAGERDGLPQLAVAELLWPPYHFDPTEGEVLFAVPDDAARALLAFLVRADNRREPYHNVESLELDHYGPAADRDTVATAAQLYDPTGGSAIGTIEAAFEAAARLTGRW